MSTIRIVIVGCQYGGANFLKTFLRSVSSPSSFPDSIQITVINKTDFFFHNVAAPRTIVDPTHWIARSVFPLDNIFGPYKRDSLRFIHGTVSSVFESHVVYTDTTGSENQVDFDILIVATGSSVKSPFKLQAKTVHEAQNEVNTYAEYIKKANSVVIVGGGPTGCEVAGEIATEFPEKHVHLVHAGEKLLHGHDVPEKLSVKVLDNLKKKKVHVYLNERLDLDLATFQPGPQTIKTSSGKEIESDWQVFATGLKLNTEIFASLKGGSVLNDKNEVKVSPNLQVDGFNNIFAIGDIANLPVFKLSYLAQLEAEFLGKQLAKIVKKTTADKKPLDQSQLKNIPAFPLPPMKAMFVTNGRNGGAGAFNKTVVGNFVVSMVKSKEMFWKKAASAVNK